MAIQLRLSTFLSCLLILEAAGDHRGQVCGAAEASGDEASGSTDAGSSASKESENAWDSPKLRAIERTWTKLPASSFASRRGEYGAGIDQLVAILARRLSPEELRYLAASTRTMPLDERDQSAFASALLQAMVIIFTDSGDRRALVTLLATRFPARIYLHNDIEYYLVVHGKKYKDPILILGDAFSTCAIAQTRREIAEAFRRGFAGSGITGKDDSEFVANALRWYREQRGHLVVNDDYGDNVLSLPQKYGTVPLFRNRPTPGGGKRERSD
jgi:hypothetical protein